LKIYLHITKCNKKEESAFSLLGKGAFFSLVVSLAENQTSAERRDQYNEGSNCGWYNFFVKDFISHDTKVLTVYNMRIIINRVFV